MKINLIIRYVANLAISRCKIGFIVFCLVVLACGFHVSHAVMWDNPNQFEPDEIASEDVFNGMYVCVNDHDKKKPFPKSSAKRLRYCGCVTDFMRNSASIEAFKKKIKDVGQLCILEASRDQGVKSSEDLFLNAVELYTEGMACQMRMKLERSDLSLHYRSIACGCIMDAARKERSLTPSQDNIKLCHDYAEKESRAKK